MSSNPLVITPIDGEPRIDSRLVAVQLDVDHKNTRELIEKYSSQFEELGILRFETAKPPPGSLGGRPEKFYLLNKSHTEVCQFCGDSGRSYPTLENPDGVVCDCMLNRNDP